MSRSCFLHIAACLIVLESTAGDVAGQQSSPSNPATVWIYRNIPSQGERDTRTTSEQTFGPYGFMPADRVNQVAVNATKPVDESNPKMGTCIEYRFQFRNQDDWVGVYTLVGGNAWGTKPGINVQELLDVSPDANLNLRFRAAGEGTVTFKIGGVNTGPHRSSLPFPHEARPSPCRLTPEFREYTIGPIQARELTNVIDPFCVVTTVLDNRGRNTVRVEVDDIRFEPLERRRKDASLSLPKDWRQRLSQTFLVTYTPTGFDPTVKPIKQPTADAIRADLAAIRALADGAGIRGERAGIVTYGCRDGLEQIAPLCREYHLSVLLGLFNPRDLLVEVPNAEKLLAREDLNQTIIACSVGNEAITFRRASFEEIQQVAHRLREVRAVPMTTTEIVQAYGDERLFSFDFALVNAHALFSNIFRTDEAAKWALQRVEDLRSYAPKGYLILVKEFGWPAGPAPAFDDAQQKTYWETILKAPIAKQVNVGFFDGLNNVGWKNETITLPGGDRANIGPHWPVLFGPERKPKPFAVELLKLWSQSRPR